MVPKTIASTSWATGVIILGLGVEPNLLDPQSSVPALNTSLGIVEIGIEPMTDRVSDDCSTTELPHVFIGFLHNNLPNVFGKFTI